MTAMKLIRGVRPGPLRTVLYGPEGIGKTTLASEAPGAAFLCAEDGQRYHNVARIPWGGTSLARPSWKAVAPLLADAADLADVGTLVIDTLDALEGLCAAEVAGANGSLEDFGGGYGKGAKRVGELWRGMLDTLDRIQQRKPVNVILLAHAKRITQKNPGGMEWQRWGLSLMETTASLTTAWADDVLFASFEVEKSDPRKRHSPGQATGRRIVRTVTGAGWVAKNRVGLPDPLPLSFAAYWEKREAALRGEVDASLRREAEALCAQLPDEKRLDAQGRSLLDLAVSGGPARVRRFIGWAQEQIEAAQIENATPNDPDPTPETAPGDEDRPPGDIEQDQIEAELRTLEADTIASASGTAPALGAKVAEAVEKFHGTPGIKRPARKSTT